MVNYFELYGLPQSFYPDAAAVKNRYYDLSRRYHPDRYTMATSHERVEALRMAAINNDAWKTFSSPDRTIAYILKINELLEAEEKYSLPPDFLMEMMDLNEAVSEYELEADDESLKEQATSALNSHLQQWDEEAGPLMEQYDAGDRNKELLLRIKDYYFRKKYLLRIQERINTFASR